jgi:hypothetical protein
MTPAEAKRGYIRVMDRMLKKGWLHSHTFTDGKGHHLNWTTTGSAAAMEFKQWCELLALEETDDRAYIMHVVTSGIPFATDAAGAGKLNETLLRLISAGFASRASYDPTGGLQIVWTARGVDFRDRFNAAVHELGFAGNADDLLFFCHTVTGWAPNWNTPVRFVG